MRPEPARLPRSTALAARAHELIPGGCHTYSKGDDQFPDNAPRMIERGDGCRVWDVDGIEYLDWGMGLRSVILGYQHPRVMDAVMRELHNGPNFTRPAPVEVELAEEITRHVPCAEMVKFAKNGSDVTSAAIRLARAFTGRDLVAFCQGPTFFSFDDWFIGTTPCSSGVPRVVADLSLPFRYNDLASLERLFERHPDGIGCVILEPATLEHPRDGFLDEVKRVAHAHGALVIFDEMITGFRWAVGGAQTYYGVTPDLATFGKALGNGFSVAALAGRRDVMHLGGTHHDRERVFLLSSTHGAETHSLAAATETVREIAARDVPSRLWATGRRLQEGFNALAAEIGVDHAIECTGIPCSPYFVTRDERGEPSMAYRTLFLQEMVERGVLVPYVAVSLPHGEKEVERTLAAAREALVVYRDALRDGIDGRLRGPAVKPVFRKYN